MSTTGTDPKAALSDAIDAWVADRYTPNQMVIEYVVVVKTVDISEADPPANYMWGWRPRSDKDVITMMLIRALRWMRVNT